MPLGCDPLRLALDRTAEFRSASDQWRETAGLSHAEFARQVRDEEIDVLVELTGHGPRNRLEALHSRPTPLQISWLDYFHSTGAAWVDCFLPDRYLVPESNRRSFAGSVQYLPRGRLCYSPPENAPEPGLVQDGKLVLGCFNRLAKLNDHLLSIWAKLMEKLPESTLFLRAVGLEDPSTRQRFTNRAEKAGIPMARVRLVGPGSYGEVLESYRIVDIALDPFPFSGCATTCDALWMGVPVISWCGESFASRQSAALLSQIGMRELVAYNPDDYVKKAVSLAADLKHRQYLREILRLRVQEHLSNADGFAHDLCHTIEHLWEQTSGRS